MSYTTETLPGSLVVIKTTLPADKIESKKAAAIAALQDKVKIDGYRPGHVPADILTKKVGELAVWTEAAEELIPDTYIEILTKEKIAAIGRPSIAITKIAAGSDVDISITVTVIPTVTVPDYKKIAKEIGKEKMDCEVSDTEIEEAITMLRKMKAQEVKAKLAGAENAPKLSEVDEADLPELTDDFVKTLSPDFANVADFREKLKHNIGHEKTHKALDSRRATLLEKIIAETVCDVPELLTGYELDRMMAQFDHDLAMNGITMEKYLEHIKKTREEMLAEMKPEAVKRAKMQLVLQKISEAEKVEVATEKIDTELEVLKSQYGSNPDFNIDNARAYLETVLHNQAVIEKLEELGGFDKHVCE